MIEETFANLFVGSPLAHGQWLKDTGNMSTILSPATSEDFSKHLKGEVGLGIVPVDDKGMCRWGAIDIDIDTVSHKDLYGRVSSRNIPLSVCRSKSGGAHCYAFFKDPKPASSVQTLLKRWAALLGFPSNTEIFPKQTKSTVTNVGNWLNLCYFGGENTVRYAVDDSGSLSLEDFIRNIHFYTGQEKIDEKFSSDLIQIDEMPPCLKTLSQEGLPSGTRNVGLFSFGVFYKKSSPNGWQDKLRNHNQNYLSPPLASREVEALVKSLESRQYQYKCDTSPLCDHCDRKTCLTLPYGIGNKSYEDGNNFDEIVVTNLRKLVTDPPTYILEINGRDISLTSEQFRIYNKLRDRVFEIHDCVTRPMKQSQWDQKLRELLAHKTDIEAPDDASAYGAVSAKIDDFLSLSDRSKTRDDLLRGLPIFEEGRVLFQASYLQNYLVSRKVVIDNKDLFATLHRRACSSELIKIKGKVVRAWSIPANLVNKQIEDYTDAKFDDGGEGEL